MACFGKGPSGPREIPPEIVSDKDYKKLNKTGRRLILELSRENYGAKERNSKLLQELNEVKASYSEYRIDRESQLEELQLQVQQLESKYKDEVNWHFILKECERMAEEKMRTLEEELQAAKAYAAMHQEQKVILKQVLQAQREEIIRGQAKRGDPDGVAKTLDMLSDEVLGVEKQGEAVIASLPDHGGDTYTVKNVEKGTQAVEGFVKKMKRIRVALEQSFGTDATPDDKADKADKKENKAQTEVKQKEEKKPVATGGEGVLPVASGEIAQLLKNKDLHIDLLMKQVRSMGVEPVSEIVSLEEAKSRVFDAMRRLNEGEDKAEKDLDKWLAFIKNHPETIEAERKKNEEFLAAQKAANEEALRITRTMVPPDIWVTTLHDLKARGLHEAIAERVWKKRALWLTRYPPEKIARMHLGLLRSKFAVDGLDLTELRAVFECLPRQFEADPDKQKEAWATSILALLQAFIAKEEKRELPRDKKRAACYLKQFRGPFNPDAPPELPEVKESLKTRERDLKDELELCRRRSTSAVMLDQSDSGALDASMSDSQSRVKQLQQVGLAATSADSSSRNSKNASQAPAAPVLTVAPAPATTTPEQPTKKWWQPTIRSAAPLPESPKQAAPAPSPAPAPAPVPVRKPAPAPAPATTTKPPGPKLPQGMPAMPARSFMDEIKSRRKN